MAGQTTLTPFYPQPFCFPKSKKLQIH